MNNNMKKLTKGTCIHIDKNFRFAIFIPSVNGITVKLTNDPPQEGFVIARENSSNCVLIPRRIRIAYRIQNEVCIESIDKETLYIHAVCQTDIPKPLRGVTFQKESVFHAEDAIETGTVVLNSAYKIYIGNLLPEDWLFRKITVYTGNSIRIEVQNVCPATARNYSSFQQMQNEFGTRCQWFAGKSMSFIQEIKNETSMCLIPAPKFFRNTAGMKVNDTFRWYKIIRNKKTVYVFAPETVSCAFDQKEINPAEQIPEKLVLCEGCAENTDEIGLLMKELKEIKVIMSMLVEQCTRNQKVNKQLRSELIQITDFLSEK